MEYAAERANGAASNAKLSRSTPRTCNANCALILASLPNECPRAPSRGYPESGLRVLEKWLRPEPHFSFEAGVVPPSTPMRPPVVLSIQYEFALDPSPTYLCIRQISGRVGAQAH